MSLRSSFWKNDKKIMKSLPESIIFSRDSEYRKWFAKGTPQCTCRIGSLTVEAAIIIPLVTAFFVLLLFFFRIMQVQLVVQDALSDTARMLALYAGTEEQISNVQYLALAKGSVAAKLSEDKNVENYVTGELLGISLLESEFEGEEIFLKANYRMKLPFELLGRYYVYLHQQVCYRKWTGWKERQAAGTEHIVYVYVTETGKVYHQTSSCPYLDLSIRSVKLAEVQRIRNESGQKYRKCNECAEENVEKSEVYITSYGECYHDSLSCSGLKRTIYKIELKNVGGRNKCRKCWN